ncbi:MAG: hypothetical protein ACRCS9_11615 [Hyphomicrobium sp.]
MRTLVASLALAVTMAVGTAPVGAADAEVPKATPLIFERQHLNNTNAGDEIIYKFERKSSNEATAGASFNDTINLKIAEVKDGKRNVELRIYTAERAREVQKITELSINPMFVVTMQQAVASYRLLAGGDFAYLKNRFSKSMAEQSRVEPLKIDYKGQQVDAYRVSMEPYKSDPNTSKMRGYEVSEFSLIVSEKVPGEIVEVNSVIKSSAKDAPMFEERTTIDGFGGVK